MEESGRCTKKGPSPFWDVTRRSVKIGDNAVYLTSSAKKSQVYRAWFNLEGKADISYQIRYCEPTSFCIPEERRLNHTAPEAVNLTYIKIFPTNLLQGLRENYLALEYLDCWQDQECQSLRPSGRSMEWKVESYRRNCLTKETESLSWSPIPEIILRCNDPLLEITRDKNKMWISFT